MLDPAGPPRSSGAASLVTALSLARHSCELVARTRPVGCRPLLELGDELFVRYRHRRAAVLRCAANPGGATDPPPAPRPGAPRAGPPRGRPGPAGRRSEGFKRLAEVDARG